MNYCYVHCIVLYCSNYIIIFRKSNLIDDRCYAIEKCMSYRENMQNSLREKGNRIDWRENLFSASKIPNLSNQLLGGQYNSHNSQFISNVVRAFVF